MNKDISHVLSAGLLAIGLNLHAADLSAAALAQAEPVPYGSKDFYPSAERPIGFRGDGTGHFPGATPPLSFSEKDRKNVLWSVKMPSWSQSSPIVVGNCVITAAEPDTTLCVDADTGRILWQDALGPFPKLTFDPASAKESGKYVQLWCGNGYSWPCSDGELAVKAWIGRKANIAAALVCYEVRTGKRLWMVQFSRDHQTHKFTREGGRWAWKKTGEVQHADYAPVGFGSPRLYGVTVIYHARSQDACYLVALDKLTGALRWTSPPGVCGHAGCDVNVLIVRVGGRDVLVTNIGTVLDPKSGQILGDAIPSVTKDGKTFSRLWGLVEKGPKGEVKIAGISPIGMPGAEGVVAFGPEWGRISERDKWDEAPEDGARKPSAYCYLAVRLGLDAQGKLTTTCLFPERAVVPKFEYGNAHMTILKNQLIVMPGYGSSLAAIALESGKLVVPPRQLWRKPRPVDIKPDPNAPDIRAALDEFGLTIGAVTEFGRGIGRNGHSSYSRTFVDGRGYIWYMNRQAQFHRIGPQEDLTAELAGTLVHPECWTSTSSPVPHGNRIYVRTFGRLACIGEK